KLADYIGAGRRLLGIVPPGAAMRIIEQCGGATIQPTASDAELAEFLKREIEIARRSKQRNSTALPSISPEILTQYAAEHVAESFDALCHSAIGAGNGRDLAA